MVPVNNPDHKHPCPYQGCLDANGDQRKLQSPHNVDQHVRAAHMGDAGRQYKCPLCPGHPGFTRPAVLNRHQLEVHGIDRRPGRGGTTRRKAGEAQSAPEATKRRDEIAATDAMLEHLRNNPPPAGKTRKSKTGLISNHKKDGFRAPTLGLAAQQPLPAFVPPSQSPQAFAFGSHMPGPYGLQTAMGQPMLTPQAQPQVDQSYAFNNQGFPTAPQSTRQNHCFNNQRHGSTQKTATVGEETIDANQPQPFRCCYDPDHCAFATFDVYGFGNHVHLDHGVPTSNSCWCPVCAGARGDFIPDPNYHTFDGEIFTIAQADPQQAADHPRTDFELFEQEMAEGRITAVGTDTDMNDEFNAPIAQDPNENAAFRRVLGHNPADLTLAPDPAHTTDTKTNFFNQQTAAYTFESSGNIDAMAGNNGRNAIDELIAYHEEGRL